MKKLIVNADDFGYSNSVNYGIVDCFNMGIVTSTTLMPNAFGFDHAIKLAKENKGLGVGVHLTLTFGRPLLNKKNTLTDENGDFHKVSFFESGNEVDENELYEEWDAQIQKIIKAGINPTHLDSHHHAHTFGPNQNVVVKLAQKYKLPVRGNFDKVKNLKHVDYFDYNIDGVAFVLKDENKQKAIQNIVNKFLEYSKDANTIEVMCHPAYIGKEILENSSFSLPRINQVDFLINSDFSKEIKAGKFFELCNYKTL